MTPPIRQHGRGVKDSMANNHHYRIRKKEMWDRTSRKLYDSANFLTPTVYMCFVAKHTPQNVPTEEPSALVCQIDWFAAKAKSLPKLNVTSSVVCWTWIQAPAIKFTSVLHVMYILTGLHHGINPECNAISRNKMILNTGGKNILRGAQLLSNRTLVNLYYLQ